jgi:hypothetical protein
MEELVDMAKAHTIDDVINSIVNNYQILLVNAVAHVAEQAKKDIKSEAVKMLVHFYYGGYDPTSYYRTGALIQSIIPFSKISAKGQTVQCVVGVEYSPEALKAYLETFEYPYKASNKYGEPDPEWVIENFWEGKHPYTDGSREPGAEINYHKSKYTQEQAMHRPLQYYAHTTFPHAVMSYMLVEGSKLF